MFSLTHFRPHFCFSLQINANCQIRSVYFSDKVYSNDELPRDYRLNLSGVSQTGPGGPAATAGTSVLVPAGSGRHRQGLHHPQSGMQAAAAGEEYICGFYTILNSTDKEPLKFWATEVSISKTRNFVTSVFPVINSIAIVLYTLIFINLYHNFT